MFYWLDKISILLLTRWEFLKDFFQFCSIFLRSRKRFVEPRSLKKRLAGELVGLSWRRISSYMYIRSLDVHVMSGWLTLMYTLCGRKPTCSKEKRCSSTARPTLRRGCSIQEVENSPSILSMYKNLWCQFGHLGCFYIHALYCQMA